MQQAATPFSSTITSPFPCNLNPHVAELDRIGIAWAREHKLLSSAQVEAVRAVKAHYLLAWAYPTAAIEPLALLHRWNMWLLVWEDRASESDLADQPAQLHALHQRLLAVAAQPATAPATTAIERAFADLCRRLQARLQPVWMERFSASLATVFRSWEWEAENRAYGRMPDEATYIAWRYDTGALGPYLALTSIIATYALPPSVTDHPTVQRLTSSICLLVGLANDLISAPKEREVGDPHNLILILERAHSWTPEQSLRYARERYETEVTAFLAMSAALPAFGPDQSACDLYIATLRNWLAATIAWGQASARYAPGVEDAGGGLQRERCVSSGG